MGKEFDAAGLKAKGYSPLPVPEGYKHPRGIKGWQHLLDWSGRAPGLGLNLRGLAMIDFDIKSPDDEDTVEWVTGLADSVCRDAPLRYRNDSPSCALLVRVPELEEGGVPHTYLSTAKWRSDDVDARVEIKLGAGHFMFGWGTHPKGERLIWDKNGVGDAPHPDDFTAFHELPVMTIAELVEAAERLETALAERFAPLQPLQGRRSAQGWTSVQDLHWGMKFRTESGWVTLEDVWNDICADPNGHAWVNLTPWRKDSDSMAGHVIACEATPGYPAIFDFAHQVQHFFDEHSEMAELEALELPCKIKPLRSDKEGEAPSVTLDDDIARASDLHRLVFVRSRAQYLYVDDPEEVWMTEKAAFHGFSAKEKSELVRQVPAVQRTVWDPQLPALTTVHNFERNWAEHNNYAPPQHTREGGNTDAFDEWFERFLPDLEERETVLNWLAHKVQKPWDRMFALVLVGPEGSGKGTLWKTIRLLWGARSVSEVGSIQSIYDAKYQDMLYRALFVLVDEVSSEDALRVGRRVAHEKLKSFCEPQSGYKLLNIKGKEQLHAKICASVGIATNNINALPIGRNDRRFFVASTGDEMDPITVQRVQKWLTPVNLASLYQKLAARDLSGFNAMRAPDSAAKEDMHRTNVTDVDEALENFKVLVRECGGVCLAKQAYEYFEILRLEHEEYSRAKRAFRRACPDQVYRSAGTNDGKTFRGYRVDIRKRPMSGKVAWDSIQRVCHELDTLRSTIVETL